MTTNTPTKVAIACQGGGSHTAFTAGVLKGLLDEWVDEGHLPESEFRKTDVHRIEMGQTYHCSTKVDRSQKFIRELMELGEQRAAEFTDQRDS